MIGSQDAFERRYTQRFRLLAGEHGEFTFYERDRGARDIGLHLTRKSSGGSELLTSTFTWFQLKGIRAATIPEWEAKSLKTIPISLETKHLTFWYLQPTPTFLALYLESLDQFYFLNLPKYVESHWGKNILNLDQVTATVHVPVGNVLDGDMFEKLIEQSDVRQWARILQADEGEVELTIRDYNVIRRAATARDRGVDQKMVIWDWQSKTRGEVRFFERPKGASHEVEWDEFHRHWQYFLRGEDVEAEFPYLTLAAISAYDVMEQDSDDGMEEPWYDPYESDPEPSLELPDGTRVRGREVAGEVIFYDLRFELNDIGKQMDEWIQIMIRVGVLDEDHRDLRWISIAPWHWRDI